MPPLSGRVIGDKKDGQIDEHNHRAAYVESLKEWYQEKPDSEYAEYDEVLTHPIFAAGRCVAPGVYRRVGSDFIVRLYSADFLPASLDGTVAHYFLTTDVVGDL